MRKSNSLYIKGEQLGVTMLHKPVKLYVFHNDAERIQRDINIEPSFQWIKMSKLFFAVVKIPISN